MKKTITVMIIDDHPLFREGFKSVIKNAPRFKVIGEALDGITALKLATELRPDLAVTNISMPGMDGIELTRILKTILPEIKVVILSSHLGINHISLAMHAGASAYLAKNSPLDLIMEGINAVADSTDFVDINIPQAIPREDLGIKVLEHYESQKAYENLAPREQQILFGLVNESSYQELAARFACSTKTIENHRSNIMRKLGLKREVELIRFGARIGLTSTRI